MDYLLEKGIYFYPKLSKRIVLNYTSLALLFKKNKLHINADHH